MGMDMHVLESLLIGSNELTTISNTVDRIQQIFMGTRKSLASIRQELFNEEKNKKNAQGGIKMLKQNYSSSELKSNKEMSNYKTKLKVAETKFHNAAVQGLDILKNSQKQLFALENSLKPAILKLTKFSKTEILAIASASDWKKLDRKLEKILSMLPTSEKLKNETIVYPELTELEQLMTKGISSLLLRIQSLIAKAI